MFPLSLFSPKVCTGLELFLPKCLTRFTVKPTEPGVFFVGKFLTTNLISLIDIKHSDFLFHFVSVLVSCVFQGILSISPKLLNLLA